MIDTGSTGFMLVATSLVMLMTPGLAFFYGGLVGRKNVLAIMIQSFVSLGWTTVLWFAFGYSLCFSGGQGSVIGNFDMAFLNTDVAASFAAITWLILAWVLEKKPKFVGLLTGAVAGLATITPAAGFVTVTHAALIGIISGVVCYFAVTLKNKMKWDDALDVWGVHGVGGTIGIIMLGLFATSSINPMVTTNGLFTGGGTSFFFTQLISVLIISAYCFLFTYFMLWVINFITPVKVTKAEEEAGLDSSLHGEFAYEQD